MSRGVVRDSNLLDTKSVTTVTEEVDGGLKKIITTNTKTVTEPELIVEVDPAEYDVFEFYDEQEGV